MRQGQGKSRGRVPSKVPWVWLMTDERVAQTDLLRAVARLPLGSAVIVRHYSLDETKRRPFFECIRRAARRSGAKLLLAGDARQARAWRADGHHGRTPGPPDGKAWLHSAPAHNLKELRAAIRAGACAVLLSPLFATRSHPGARALGAARFAALARRSPIPVIALGGVGRHHGQLVRKLGAHGIAAIDSLMPRRRR